MPAGGRGAHGGQEFWPRTWLSCHRAVVPAWEKYWITGRAIGASWLDRAKGVKKDGDKITWDITGQSNYEATITGDQMTGTGKNTTNMTASYSATRQAEK